MKNDWVELGCGVPDAVSSLMHTLNNEDGGKTAHYLLRWVSRDGEKVPWSEILAATVVGM